jgi:uncharacterized protein YkwD
LLTSYFQRRCFMKSIRPVVAILIAPFIVWLLLALFISDETVISSQSGQGGMTPQAYVPALMNPEEPTPTPLPTPTPTATPLPPPTTWLSYVNWFRVQANLTTVAENSSWSNGGYLHGRYMVKNDYIGHSEDPGNPWYTAEGLAAAQNGNVAVSSSVSASDYSMINIWMTGPFHAVGILDPKLHTTGFGNYHEADGGWQSGATLDVLRGRGLVPASVTFPVRYPRSDGQLWLLSYTGGEYPNPILGCGYSTPTGGPIILQLGTGSLTPNVTAYSLMQGSTPLTACVYDETNYSFPGDAPGQSLGRSVLGSRDAIVMIPQQPLQQGQIYTVSITTNGNTHTWSFTAVASPVSVQEESSLIEIR